VRPSHVSQCQHSCLIYTANEGPVVTVAALNFLFRDLLFDCMVTANAIRPVYYSYSYILPPAHFTWVIDVSRPCKVIADGDA